MSTAARAADLLRQLFQQAAEIVRIEAGETVSAAQEVEQIRFADFAGLRRDRDDLLRRHVERS